MPPLNIITSPPVLRLLSFPVGCWPLTPLKWIYNVYWLPKHVGYSMRGFYHSARALLEKKLKKAYSASFSVLTLVRSGQADQKLRTLSGRTEFHQEGIQIYMLQSDQGNVSKEHGNHSAIPQHQSPAIAGTVVNGGARQRVRARRGQATDPHSIAERLRRERIAERMKALQELVPNSNKTDKASMLDEIIDYVKFLQLQVKVLSMSRLGGAGAVAPLIADVPTQGSGSLGSTALAQACQSLPEDGLAFEHKVAKLMESNMTSAMQYLQNKGLCLMPIALASAISSSSGNPLLGAGSAASVDGTNDIQSSGTQLTTLPLNNCSPRVGIGAGGFGSDGSLNEVSETKMLR